MPLRFPRLPVMSPSRNVPAGGSGHDGRSQGTRITEELSSKLRRRRYISEGDQNRHCFVSPRPPDAAPFVEQLDEAEAGATCEGAPGHTDGPGDAGEPAEELPRAAAPEAPEGEPSSAEEVARRPSGLHTQWYSLEALDKSAGVETPLPTPTRALAPTCNGGGPCSAPAPPSCARAARTVAGVSLLTALAVYVGVWCWLNPVGGLQDVTVSDRVGNLALAAAAEQHAKPAAAVEGLGTARKDSGNPECWADGFTFEMCCSPTHGAGGNALCWDSVYNYQRCCIPQD